MPQSRTLLALPDEVMNALHQFNSICSECAQGNYIYTLFLKVIDY